MTPRKSLLDKAREFNIGWFVPSLVKYRALFGKVLLASFLIQLFGLVTPLFFQVVMDKVLLHKALTTLNVLAIGFICASVFEVALNMLRNYVFAHTATRVDVELGARLFSHLISLPLAWFQSRQAGYSVARVKELDTLRNFLTSAALTLVIDLSFAIIYFAVMWLYSPALTVVVLVSIPLYVVLSVVVTPILKGRLDRKFRHGAANQSFLVEAVSGAETVKCQALEPQMRKRWESMLAGYVTAGFRAQNLGQVAGQVASLIQKLSTAAIVWLGARQVMEGDLTVGQLVAFNMIAGRISGPILKLTQLWQDFQQAGISLKRLGDILNAPAERGAGPSLRSHPKVKGAFSFEGVSFRYRPDAQPAVADFTLEVAPGEVVGLVGASGSGKSTLAKLIQKMYRPDSGRILLDGADLALADPGWARRSIGAVSQESVLFSGSVRDNIDIRDMTLSMDQVVTAAMTAGAHEFITGLPEGYDTQVGERGGNISGGQRQRLAIARALAYDPRVLVLDEATSALDYESERAILGNMKAICQGRTVFIIAHRLSAVIGADRVCVLDKGRIVECGPPRELANGEGAFAKMLRAQGQFRRPMGAK
jgi:subfamily B ATP-binding cassette protein HlyB/CyaB